MVTIMTIIMKIQMFKLLYKLCKKIVTTVMEITMIANLLMLIINSYYCGDISDTFVIVIILLVHIVLINCHIL